ncbi:hypothetical protein TanjilG_32478 [Lupinus angustifolius]|uniref:Formin-like protein n=1 Tax=Lupinus angustifolius TaxID=3871 RepID=A0A394DDR2_LUPAN|nr:PREDICTED: formin-like protein 6 [Lupinus angustifolius]XP_019432779.1 PREDICTED: formin-like protein 6 [Lupinus angustifolius]XP_019432780.1 PREDICTED: formin-like protein 6 [Lupinus angustifolius]OIW21338.1 hypothetical protein TanjilG_32478 [Lupinus angustifolius]
MIKPHHFIFFLIFSFSLLTPLNTATLITIQINESHTPRRFLHQPLFPVASTQPPPPPPPEDTPSSPDIPFFNEYPTQPPPPSSDQVLPSTPAAAIATNPTATQTTKPTKKIAICISVGIVTLGMLSALAFFLFKHRTKHSVETTTIQKQKELVSANSHFVPETSNNSTRPQPSPQSSFLYIGTVEPNRVSLSEPDQTGNGGKRSPYGKLNNSLKLSDRYRPSPELQPLPSLSKHSLENHPPPPASSSEESDEESRETRFHSPSLSHEEDSYYYTPVSRHSYVDNGSPATAVAGVPVVPYSKRTSPKSRLSASSPDIRHIMIPSIKYAPQPPPSLFPAPPQPRRPKFASPPPAPDLRHLHSDDSMTSFNPPPPPPPPPPPRAIPQRKAWSPARSTSSSIGALRKKQQCWSPSQEGAASTSCTKSVTKPASVEVDETDEGKPKLKALHWDKVPATSDRATVWDQLKSSSFQLNEDMMESLFGCHSTNSAPKETVTRKQVIPPVEQENRVLDPKKSQNIAILLRALNVTRDEVSEALLDGNPEGLGSELLETLVKMAPTKEEEIKLKNYDGELSRLGSAERFLKTVLDIPLAFKRVEAMLYRANFEAEVNYLWKSFQTLEAASEELKNSRLFFKLLEAVLRTGNRMNVGTNRGDAKSFKLETLLKLVDIKGTDGKTTLLHFVVQEIIRSEGSSGEESANDNAQNRITSEFNEDEFRKKGLQVVGGLSRDLGNVKKAAGMDSDVLSSYLSKLEMGLDKVRLVLQYQKSDMQGNFFNSTKLFLKDAEEKIIRIKADEKKALFLVKEVTVYFHGDTAKEEAHPLRVFMIVRDFLNILDHVCKEVGKMQDRTVIGSTRSFRIAASASLPVLSRYHTRQDRSSGEESSPP